MEISTSHPPYCHPQIKLIFLIGNLNILKDPCKTQINIFYIIKMAVEKISLIPVFTTYGSILATHFKLKFLINIVMLE